MAEACRRTLFDRYRELSSKIYVYTQTSEAAGKVSLLDTEYLQSHRESSGGDCGT